MAEETANALHVGIGVAATCIGVACSVYHCCCRVWRRLKGYTPTAAAGAVAAAGLMAAGQLSSVTTVGPPPTAEMPARGPAAPVGQPRLAIVRVRRSRSAPQLPRILVIARPLRSRSVRLPAGPRILVTASQRRSRTVLQLAAHKLFLMPAPAVSPGVVLVAVPYLVALMAMPSSIPLCRTLSLHLWQPHLNLPGGAPPGAMLQR